MARFFGLAAMLTVVGAALSPARATAEPTEPSKTERSEDAAPSEPEHRLVWREDWPRFHAIEYAATAAVWLEMGLIEWRVGQPAEPRWTGGILFDDAARDLLVGRSRAVRETADTISDPITLGLQIYAVAVDSVLVPLAFDDWNWDLAWQMNLMNLEALGTTFVLVRSLSNGTARERPSVAECRQDQDYEPQCNSGRNVAFPSGHTTGAFLGAGLMCAHHLHLPLYGGGAPDVAACVLPTVLAGADGLLRIAADRHWASDVVVGAALGFGVGYGLPVLLHYGRGDNDSSAQGLGPVRWTALPTVGPNELGLTLRGSM